MTTTIPHSHLIRLAIGGIDSQIDELRQLRGELEAQLLENLGPQANGNGTGLPVATNSTKTTRRPRPPMSPEMKAKLSKMAKARWRKFQRQQAQAAQPGQPAEG